MLGRALGVHACVHACVQPRRPPVGNLLYTPVNNINQQRGGHSENSLLWSDMGDVCVRCNEHVQMQLQMRAGDKTVIRPAGQKTPLKRPHKRPRRRENQAADNRFRM